MRAILSTTKSFTGHVPTQMAADFEHILNRIGGGEHRCKIHKEIVSEGDPYMFFEVSNIACRRPFEIRLRFTSTGWLHIDVAASRDGAALFFGLADILLQLRIDIWDNLTPKDLHIFADSLETT